MEGDDGVPTHREAGDDRRHRLAVSIEVLSVLALIAGAFLYLQYNGLSSLCALPNSDRCWKWEVRSDVGVALMVLGVVGVVTGVIAGWLRERG